MIAVSHHRPPAVLCGRDRLTATFAGLLVIVAGCSLVVPDKPEVDCNRYPEPDCEAAVALALEMIPAEEHVERASLDALMTCAPWWVGSCPPPIEADNVREFGATVSLDAGRDRPWIVNVTRVGHEYSAWWPVGAECSVEAAEEPCP